MNRDIIYVRLTLHKNEKRDGLLKNKVRELREKMGLTQGELGQAVHVSRQAIIAVEQGKYDPSIWLAYDLSVFFGIEITELFDFEGSERK